jgi:regulator of protease activity HflC (stomatin/prohibitin superfamily)
MNNKSQSGAIGTVIVLCIVVFIGVIIMSTGMDTVPANNLGVLVSFGQVKGTMTPGTRWTGLFTGAEIYDLRMRQLTVNMQGDQAAVDKDGQSVFATIDINYRFNPDNIIEAYTKVGNDAQLAKILNVEGIIKEGFKATTSKHTSTEIWQNREKIKQEAIQEISKNFPTKYFSLENVVVTNLDYNTAFKAAIEQQKTNEKLAFAKQAEVDIAKYQANIAIENARGAAESRKLDAEASAYVVLTQARAEAEGLSLRKQQITPLTIQSDMISKWSGNFPTYLIQTGAGGSNYLLNLPALPSTSTLTN